MIKMVAFDFDGTVGDTSRMCLDVFKRTIAPYVSHTVTDQEIISTYGLNEEGMLKKIVKDDWQAALDDLRTLYKAELEKCSGPFPGIPEFIEYLKSCRILTAMITGKGKWSCSLTLEKFNMQHLFCDVETGRADKPDKAGSMRKLIKKYRIEPDEFVYIGDAVSDIRAARKAGITCLSVAWCSTVDAAELERENPGHVFTEVFELQNYFRKMYS